MKHQLDFRIANLKSYYIMHKAVNLILENTNYNVSIRPHPMSPLTLIINMFYLVLKNLKIGLR